MGNSEKKEAISEVCRKYGIPSGVEKCLVDQASYISTFEKIIRRSTPTYTDTAKALSSIERLALELSKQIIALPIEVRGALDNEYFGIHEPGFDPDAINTDVAATFDLGEGVFPKVRMAAKSIRERIPGAGLPGAPKITERQADFIRCIAQVVKTANIKPAYTGVFLEICNAVYGYATGNSVPERAFKHFMKNIRPQMKAAGYCL